MINQGKSVLLCDSKEWSVQCFVKVFDQDQKQMEAWNWRTDSPANFTVLW